MTRTTPSPVGHALLCLVLAVTISASSEDAPALIVPGKPVQRTLAGATPDAFLLAAEAGQYLHVVVTQEAADVVVTLDAPDGSRLLESDLVDATEGIEPVSIVAPSTGDYRLAVRARFPDGGAYMLVADAPRAPGEADRERVDAEAMQRDGTRLRAVGKSEELEQALDRFERAAASWHALGEPRLEALSLLRQGQVCTRLSRHGEAFARLEASLTLCRALADPACEASALHSEGVSHAYQGRSRDALVAYQQALVIRRERGDRRSEAITLGSIAAAWGNLGELRKVISLSEEALALKRQLGDEQTQPLTLCNIGRAYCQLGDPQKALDKLAEGLAIAERATDPRDQAPLLALMGEAYSGLGDSREAFRLYDRSLEIWRAVGDRSGESATLFAIANEHLAQGDAAQALVEYDRVSDLHRQAGGGDYPLLTLWRAAAYRRLGDRPRAIAILNQALPEAQKSSAFTYPETLAALGQLSREEGDLDAAVRYQEQALALFQGLSARAEQATCLYELAQVDLRRGVLESALRRLEQSLALSEQMRSGVNSPELRASFGASAARVREAHLEVLVRLHERQPQGGWLERAYVAAESGRAQTLVEMLSSSRAEASGVDPELKERERSLMQKLASRLEEQFRVLKDPHTEAEAAALETEVQAAGSAHRAAQAALLAATAAVADAQRKKVLSLADVQRQVLDRDSLLLEYALGEERSFLFAIGPTSVDVHVLPGRAALDALAKAAYERLADASASSGPLAADRTLTEASRVLLGPVAQQLGERRLVVVAEGAVQLLPFAGLPAPDGTGAALVMSHEVVRLPSASLLPALRAEVAQRPRPTQGAVVFADPLFEPTDDRIAEARPRLVASAAAGPPRPFSRALSEAGLDGERIPRLAFTRREAQAIGAIVPGSRVWLDADASRTHATGSDLATYRYVHFATHGFLIPAHPELSGLVLSLFDRDGRRQEGFLSATDVFDLKLAADLVVLSGCRTALGRQVAGEGVMGLARAFMFAGTSRVVASLWKVDDAATAELMARFYEGMQRDGLRPAAALRRAQRSVAGQKRWSSPYYWAGFELQGDWN